MRSRRRLGATAALSVGMAAILGAIPSEARPGGGHTYQMPTGTGARPTGGQTHRAPPPATPRPEAEPAFDHPPDGEVPPEPGRPSRAAVVKPARRAPSPGYWLAALLVSCMAAMSTLLGRREGRRSSGWATASPDPPPPSAELEAAFAAARASEHAPSGDRPTPTGVIREKCPDVPAAIVFLGGKDEAYSRVIFEDFVSALYAAVHAKRGEGRLDDLAPYLKPEAAAAYAALPVGHVESILVSALAPMGVYAVRVPARRVDVELEIEGHYTEIDPSGGSQSWVAREIWTLSRSPDARSRTPAKARALGCPSCGAPVGVHGAVERGQRCPFCSEIIDTGAFDWLVTSVHLRFRTPREPLLLSASEEDDGATTLATVQWSVDERYELLVAADPTQSWAAFEARVNLVFQTYQQAWSEGDLAPLRPYLSDSYFELQPRFLAAYREHGLRNVVEGAHVFCIERIRVLRDCFYEAITVRVLATSLDFTLDRRNAVVAGSRERRRRYSEYWTFIRSRPREGSRQGPLTCPHCGAGLVVNMAGACNVCDVKMSSGEFDWVLSRIEQDAVYRG